MPKSRSWTLAGSWLSARRLYHLDAKRVIAQEDIADASYQHALTHGSFSRDASSSTISTSSGEKKNRCPTCASTPGRAPDRRRSPRPNGPVAHSPVRWLRRRRATSKTMSMMSARFRGHSRTRSPALRTWPAMRMLVSRGTFVPIPIRQFHQVSSLTGRNPRIAPCIFMNCSSRQ